VIPTTSFICSCWVDILHQYWMHFDFKSEGFKPVSSLGQQTWTCIYWNALWLISLPSELLSSFASFPWPKLISGWQSLFWVKTQLFHMHAMWVWFFWVGISVMTHGWHNFGYSFRIGPSHVQNLNQWNMICINTTIWRVNIFVWIMSFWSDLVYDIILLKVLTWACNDMELTISFFWSFNFWVSMNKSLQPSYFNRYITCTISMYMFSHYGINGHITYDDTLDGISKEK
jgi:hypothetical protein